MAYRFMLDTPLEYASDVEIAITKVPNVQIVTNRSSLSDGFDRPRAALTVAAPDLTAIHTLYQWMELTGTRPDIRFAFYSGRRVSLRDLDEKELVAAIRRDQPWIEPTLPKLGDHYPPAWLGPEHARATVKTDSVLAEDRNAIMEEAQLTNDGSPITIESVNYLAINVTDLTRAEKFYHDLFGLNVVARTRSDEDGNYRLLSDDYNPVDAVLTDEVADDSFLRNGALLIALHRVDRGARLDRKTIDRVSIRVDAETFNRLRGQILMNNFENLGGGHTYFAFRDPYGIPWEITMAGTLPEVIYTTLSEAQSNAR